MITTRIGHGRLSKDVKIHGPKESETSWDDPLLQWIIASPLFQAWVQTFPKDKQCWNINFQELRVGVGGVTQLVFIADMRQILDGDSVDATCSIELPLKTVK